MFLQPLAFALVVSSLVVMALAVVGSVSWRRANRNRMRSPSAGPDPQPSAAITTTSTAPSTPTPPTTAHVDLPAVVPTHRVVMVGRVREQRRAPGRTRAA